MPGINSIYSNRCWIGGTLRPATIHFKNGVITTINDHLEPGSVDFGNDVIMPGVIDAHVHVNEPGRTEWEGFETATAAAAAGGITTFADMPLNASPVTTTVKALEEKIRSANGKLYMNVVLYGGLIPGNNKDIEPLIQKGVSGIKCFLVHSGIDEFPNAELKDLEEAMPLIARYQIPLLVHCEIFDTPVDSGLSDMPGSYQHYLLSRPKKWENDAISLMIGLCRKYNCPVHIVHVSSSEALKMIAEAKKEGLPLTAETCSHYIYFNAEEIPDNDTLYKCAPPIREKANNELLKQALKDGVLDFIASDHSPAPPSIKEIESGNLINAWGGIAGLQWLLPASWSAMRNIVSLQQYIPLVTSHPARFLQLERKGEIRPGQDADFVIWSPEQSFVPSEQETRHKHKLSPYTGKQLYGAVKKTFVAGSLVFDGNTLYENMKRGKLILRSE
jgi:allantoinase